MRKILSLCFVIICLCGVAHAKEYDRWEKVDYGDSTGLNYFLDTETIDYNHTQNTVMCWVKLFKGDKDPSRNYGLEKLEIEFNSKEVSILRQLSYRDGRPQPEYAGVVKTPLTSDSVYAKIANIIARKYGNLPMFPSATEWLWVTSTSEVSYYLSTTDIRHDSDKDLWIIYTRNIDSNGRICEGPSIIAFDFSNRTYGIPVGGPTIIMNDIIPGSITESLYKVAKKICENSSNVTEIRVEDLFVR